MNNPSKNLWTQPGFLIVVVLLASCAVGLNTVVAYWKLSFIKGRVELKQDLATIPPRLGDWVQVSKDEPLDNELQSVLATDKYIFRDYVNSKLVAPSVLAKFDGKGSRERKDMLGQIQSASPEAVLNLAVTYYTGGVDTVAHIPERCYVADGYLPATPPETLQWDLGPGRLAKTAADPSIAVRFLSFEDQTGARRVTRRVAYFFFANGQYESDAQEVRETLQNLRAKYGFYSKIELMGVIPDDTQCAKIMSSFLTSAMPEIEKCYPDWNSVERTPVKQ